MSLDPHTLATMADQRAQRWHIPVSPEITQAIARTAELVFDYNATHPTHTEELDRLRRLILSPASKDCTIRQPLTIEYGVNTTIGKDTFINYGVTILDTAEVTIAYGNPARVIRTTNPHTTYEL